MSKSPRTRAAPAPELSRPVAVTAIDAEPVALDITAAGDERQRLAGRFGLLALDSLTARAELRRAAARDGSGPVIRLALDWRAEVVQTCVVTLEPVATILDERAVEVEFAPAGVPRGGRKEVAFALDDADPPEPLEGEVVDVGEALAEQLGLAIDPYPRKPDAALDWRPPADQDRHTEAGPFAALARLRRARAGEPRE